MLVCKLNAPGRAAGGSACRQRCQPPATIGKQVQPNHNPSHPLQGDAPAARAPGAGAERGYSTASGGSSWQDAYRQRLQQEREQQLGQRQPRAQPPPQQQPQQSSQQQAQREGWRQQRRRPERPQLARGAAAAGPSSTNSTGVEGGSVAVNLEGDLYEQLKEQHEQSQYCEWLAVQGPDCCRTACRPARLPGGATRGAVPSSCPCAHCIALLGSLICSSCAVHDCE